MQAQRSQDIAGTWKWSSPNGEDNFEMLLEFEDSNTLKGTHCAVFGENRDCRRDAKENSISLIKIARNIYDGTIRSGLSATAGHIRLQYNPRDESVDFVLKKLPPGEFYLPREAVLYR